MAQQVKVYLTSDLSGADATETVTFGLDGTTYEIDLTDDEAGKFRGMVAEYVGAARRVSVGRRSGSRKPRTRTERAASDPHPSDIRAWAKENGHNVPDRGRVPAMVREAYIAAQGSGKEKGK